MQIENEFTVPATPEDVWAFLLDVERVAPCMPGAELTEAVDDTTWKGRVNVALGPVSMSFAGTVRLEDRDDASRRVRLRADGTEQRGKGAVTASVSSWLEPNDVGTIVRMQADVTLTGAAAQLSRGLLPEVSKKLTQQFADCLQDRLSTPSPAEPSSVRTSGAEESSAPPVPVRGVRLGLRAAWSLLLGWIRRWVGRP
jgi:carbon monoxide dehydrogenase subunit G